MHLACIADKVLHLLQSIVVLLALLIDLYSLLEVQKEIFQVLNCNKHIGASLNSSLLMSPSKSVTAFIGIAKEKEMAETQCKDGCAVCKKTDCVYRK